MRPMTASTMAGTRAAEGKAATGWKAAADRLRAAVATAPAQPPVDGTIHGNNPPAKPGGAPHSAQTLGASRLILESVMELGRVELFCPVCQTLDPFDRYHR